MSGSPQLVRSTKGQSQTPIAGLNSVPGPHDLITQPPRKSSHSSNLLQSPGTTLMEPCTREA